MAAQRALLTAAQMKSVQIRVQAGHRKARSARLNLVLVRETQYSFWEQGLTVSF